VSAARHHLPAGTFTNQQLLADITADLKSAQGARKQMEATGQGRLAASMRAAVDEFLDELTAAQNGTWRPRHA
jgi:hypothetical protein